MFCASVAVAAATVTAPAQAAATSPAAPAAPVLHRAQAAAGWLARQMVNRNHFTETFDGTTFPDQGLTIDAVLAFAATATADNYASRAMTWLARPHILSGYIGNGTTSSFAGATANLMLATEVRGADPAAFGGVNLPARLAALLTASGRYSDQSKFGDFSNVLGQSLAIVATSRDGGAPASAVNFLISSACGNGGFPVFFGEKHCSSSPDATGEAVQALLAAGRPAAAKPALSWLASVQQADGGFGISATGTPNANSTGLAGEALAAAGWAQQAARARAFLYGQQVGCSGEKVQQGALAFNGSGFRKGTAAFATAQGILGLAGVGLAQLSGAGSQPGDPRLSCSS